MAREILREDPTNKLGVLTVDWSEGATGGITLTRYNPPAANTRYVGVATERIITQLGGADLEVHCIGHSLGAHTCSFLGNAVKDDTEFSKQKVDRITGMDPACPQNIHIIQNIFLFFSVRS